MADVVITLKLGASEYQTLRTELLALNEALLASVRDAAKNPAAYGSHKDRQELTRRSAQLAFLVEKL